MGTFNVACSITELTINEGDAVAFIPLERNTRLREQNYFLEVGGLYKAKCPPIFGEYDGGGKLTNIQETGTTLLIKEKSNLENLTNSTGMFVLKEVYDELTSFRTESNGKIVNYDENSPFLSRMIEILEQRKSEINIEKLTKKLCDKSIAEGKELSKEEESILINIQDRLMSYEEFGYEIFQEFYFKDFNVDSFNVIYSDLFINSDYENEALPELKKFFVFCNNLMALNKMFRPTLSGWQYGCKNAEKRLNNFTQKLVTERYKKKTA